MNDDAAIERLATIPCGSLEDLVRPLPAPLMVVNRKTRRVQGVSAGYLEFFGHAQGNLVETFAASAGPWDNNRFERILEELENSGTVDRVELDCISDGSKFRVMVCGWVVTAADSSSLLLSFTDVTHLTNSHGKQERYRALFENTHTVMLIIDPADGSIVDANPAACIFYGYGRATLQTMNISSINTLSPREIAEEMERARTSRRNHFHFTHRLASGEMREVEVYSGPILFDGRELLYSIIYDITERRRVERLVRETTEELDRFFSLSPVLLGISDFEGVILRVNRRWEEVLQLPVERIVGTSVFQYVHPEDMDRTVRELDAIRRGESVHGFVNRWVRADGSSRWIEWNAVGYHGSRIYAVARDVTERIENELELRNARDRAEEASRVKSRFLAMMSHEIRTPLNAIIGFATLALADDHAGCCRETFAMILDSSRTLLSVVNDILEFSRLEAGSVSTEEVEFSPADLLHDVSLTARGWVMERPISVDVVTDPSLPLRVVGDLPHIRQILMNLVNNAVKFTDRGSVLLKGRGERGADPAGGITLVFAVSDTGIGIPPERLDTIFLPFTQLDDTPARRHGGTGLGLSICRSLCDLLGGHIQVKSALGKGTTFEVSLPTKVAEVSPSLVPKDSCGTTVPIPSLAGTSILVAEDNPVNQILMRSMLQRLGADVVVVADGEEVLKLLEKDPERFRLILMDVEMPRLDGCETTRRIRNEMRMRHIPIIAVTAHAFSSELKRCTDAGMNDCITKPVDFRVLASRLGSLLGRSAEREELAADEVRPPRSLTIDLNDLARRFDADQQICAQILGGFVDSCQRFRDAIEDCRNVSDWDHCMIQLHSLKGVAANISAPHLRRLASEAETSARQRDRSRLGELLDPLAAELERVEREALALTKRLTSAGEADSIPPRKGV